MPERLKGFIHAPDGMGSDPVRHHYYEAQTNDRQEPQIWVATPPVSLLGLTMVARFSKVSVAGRAAWCEPGPWQASQPTPGSRKDSLSRSTPVA